MCTKRAGCGKGCWEVASPWLLETESMEKNKMVIERKDYSGVNLEAFDMLHSSPGKNCLRFILYFKCIRTNLHSPLAAFLLHFLIIS